MEADYDCIGNPDGSHMGSQRRFAGRGVDVTIRATYGHTAHDNRFEIRVGGDTMTGCRWTYSDGGRAAAGFAPSAPGDCACRAIAIAGRLPYLQVYDRLNEVARRERPRAGGRRSSSRTGVKRQTIHRYLVDELGWTWTPTMGIGTGCRVHLRPDELPAGRIVANLSKHLCAVVDGVVFDTADPTRGGTRCVYGYWTPTPGGPC